MLKNIDVNDLGPEYSDSPVANFRTRATCMPHLIDACEDITPCSGETVCIQSFQRRLIEAHNSE